MVRDTAYPVFEVPDDILFSFPYEKPKLLRTGRLALIAVSEAISNAGFTPENLQEKRTGICFGTTVGSPLNNAAFYQNNNAGCDPAVPLVEKFLLSNPTVAIADEFNISGIRQTVVNACSASSDAIGLAASWIESDICDVVIAGGADELSQMAYNGFISLMISDEFPCRPFDKDRNGLNLGEGAAVMILESERSCRNRHQPPLGYLLGYGTAADAFHFTSPHPQGEGLKTAIHDALSFSGVTAENVGFINAHGTGTQDNDRVETMVISEMFPGTPFFSTKGFTGHTLGAAGAVEAVFSLACLNAARIPASPGFNRKDPDAPVEPTQKATPVSGVCISQTLAFGGNNSVLVLGSRKSGE
jgi:3-oxoacyl-[acyl-carrier-protein] synthase-1/3-oxoacyl-[acyl-carrier-protein] synthase II